MFVYACVVLLIENTSDFFLILQTDPRLCVSGLVVGDVCRMVKELNLFGVIQVMSMMMFVGW